MRLSSTGAIWTRDKQANFEQQSQSVGQDRLALYQSEKAQGTPPAEILAKIFDQINAQPQGYKDAINWH